MPDTTTVPDALPARVRRFPFPFDQDSYRYHANVEPAGTAITTAVGSWGAERVHVDAGYVDELAQRRDILAADETRVGELPHMRAACWDTLMWGLGHLAADHPTTMSLRRHGDGWLWRNDLLGVRQAFRYGDDSSLPTDPLRFIGSQLQEDLVLLDQREDALFADAGLVTFAADWSMRFDLGMAFVDIHRPVPRLVPENIIPRAQQFLLRLQPGADYRRLNWTLSATPRLDVSTETYDEWGRTRRLAVEHPDEAGERLHLRVEVQHFVRLAPSNAVLFPIRTYLLPFADVARVPEWTRRLCAVLTELPQDMADYKGLARYRDVAVDWLRAQATRW
ncbi:DUF3445 domain-containing protein [uncultured Jatrophihabitans sp.]|uniref:heme-dependent oxidative N-demethylase family protein n=1 Tax=uncultured Jatrophihabitans sp. TaxID=1610747 RepID=UPI0035CBB927